MIEEAASHPVILVQDTSTEHTPEATPLHSPLPEQPFEPEMILIPAGEFLMGSDPHQDHNAYDYEQPQHRLYLPAYYIAKTPVTNAQYRAFVLATGHKTPVTKAQYTAFVLGHKTPDVWTNRTPPRGQEDHPVASVSWYDANDYCCWLSEVTGRGYSLPSEAEWEKGARGTDGRIYPWGNEWEAERCNAMEAGRNDTSSVGAHPTGVSPYGLLDMAGNVWEWTRNVFEPYPRNRKDLDNALSNLFVLGVPRPGVLRGGSFLDTRVCSRCAYRKKCDPGVSNKHMGFRVVVHP